MTDIDIFTFRGKGGGGALKHPKNLPGSAIDTCNKYMITDELVTTSCRLSVTGNVCFRNEEESKVGVLL